MYRLTDSLIEVKGVGPKLFESFEKAGFKTIKDLLLHLPFRYEDRSVRFTIDQIKQLAHSPEKKLFTLEAMVKSSRSAYLRGRSLQSATLVDESGTITASWFNNPHIVNRLKTGQRFLFSGNVGVSKKGQIFLTQPIVESMDHESIHTDRLVPVYSNIPGILPTVVRKFQKEILDSLSTIEDPVTNHLTHKEDILPLSKALQLIHFPDDPEQTIKARERFAIEELIMLIQHSHAMKEEWKKGKQTIVCSEGPITIPQTIPFELTKSQLRSAVEICSDLSKSHPMNRLLIGDVGSGKTIVAGLAMTRVVKKGYFAALVAPTQILAEQHAKTLQTFFPDIPMYLTTGKTKTNFEEPGFIVGTHAVLNVLPKLEKRPAALIVFDEQHRFGVRHRSELEHLGIHPHVLTMTATPIPRSYMLSIFSHLSLSTIDELPKNRIPTKTWVLPEIKRESMYSWIKEQTDQAKKTDTNFLTLIVCPFINPSESEALENVAAVKDMYEQVKLKFAPKLTQSKAKPVLALLHGKQKKVEKDTVMKDLFAGKIDILVTTPIIEVGVDLPQASAIIIEAAERFGLASLHQLRGRVGRAGQQGYCLLFTTKPSAQSDTKKLSSNEVTKRLKKFEATLNGRELAELDLQNRGAGDLFGTQQHGFDQLKFASWTDFNLIRIAKDVCDESNARENGYISPLLQIREQKTILAN